MMHATQDRSVTRFCFSNSLRLCRNLPASLTGLVRIARRGLAGRKLNHKAHAEAAAMQTRLLAMLDNTSDLVALYDLHGRICYCNHAGRQMLQLEETQNSDADESAQHTIRCDTYLQDALFPIGIEQGTWRGERILRSRDGREIPVSQVVIVHKDAHGHVVYLSTIARDITERKQLDAQMQQQLALIQEQKAKLEVRKAELIQANKAIAEAYIELADANTRLEMLATTDGLTGLGNHREFQERLADEFQRVDRYHIPLSLILVDVDRFKQYNDTFGHPAGDEALRIVAATLQSNSRQTDFVARYGGEEFVIVLPETDRQGAIEAAERVRQAIATQPWSQRAVTVSVGVATCRLDTDSPAMLIEEADKALYISKEFGRNCVTHHDAFLAVISQACNAEVAT